MSRRGILARVKRDEDLVRLDERHRDHLAVRHLQLCPFGQGGEVQGRRTDVRRREQLRRENPLELVIEREQAAGQAHHDQEPGHGEPNPPMQPDPAGPGDEGWHRHQNAARRDAM